MTDIVHSPPALPATSFTDAAAAVDQLIELYERNTTFLRNAFERYLKQDLAPGKYRTFYPEAVSYTHLTLPTICSV